MCYFCALPLPLSRPTLLLSRRHNLNSRERSGKKKNLLSAFATISTRGASHRRNLCLRGTLWETKPVSVSQSASALLFSLIYKRASAKKKKAERKKRKTLPEHKPCVLFCVFLPVCVCQRLISKLALPIPATNRNRTALICWREARQLMWQLVI